MVFKETDDGCDVINEIDAGVMVSNDPDHNWDGHCNGH